MELERSENNAKKGNVNFRKVRRNVQDVKITNILPLVARNNNGT